MKLDIDIGDKITLKTKHKGKRITEFIVSQEQIDDITYFATRKLIKIAKIEHPKKWLKRR